MSKEIELSNGVIIKMREPKVKDMKIARAAGKTEEDQEFALIGNLTGLAPSEVEDLTLKDYSKLTDGLKDFL